MEPGLTGIPLKVWMVRSLHSESTISGYFKGYFYALGTNQESFVIEVRAHSERAREEVEAIKEAFNDIVDSIDVAHNDESWNVRYKKLTLFERTKLRGANKKSLLKVKGHAYSLHCEKKGDYYVWVYPFVHWRSNWYWNWIQSEGAAPNGIQVRQVFKSLEEPTKFYQSLLGNGLELKAANNIMAKLCHLFGNDKFDFSFEGFSHWRSRSASNKNPVIYFLSHVSTNPNELGHAMLGVYYPDTSEFVVHDTGSFVRCGNFYNDVRQRINKKHRLEDTSTQFSSFHHDQLMLQNNSWSCCCYSIGMLIVLLMDENPAGFEIKLEELFLVLTVFAKEPLKSLYSLEEMFKRVAVRTRLEAAKKEADQNRNQEVPLR